ncbi:MAG: malonate transporter [Myxococcota bacterium]|jgi:malonate transporter
MMAEVVGLLRRILPLFAIIGLGSACAGLRVFPNVPLAVATLNRFALYIGFPCLIVAGLASDALVLPDAPAFYALHVAGSVVMISVAFFASRSVARGPVALGTLFGNIAYLGIPLAASALGAAAAGLASLSAAIHIALAMTFGPVLLIRWGTEATPNWSRIGGKVIRQPLVWAPFVGLAVRWLPDSVADPILGLCQPMAAAAGPIALFMVGLYLWHHRNMLRVAGRDALLISGLKLLVYPVVAAVLVGAVGYNLSPLERSVLILQAGMPVAITTFSLAEEYGVGQRAIAAAIVVSTLGALVTLPVILLLL